MALTSQSLPKYENPPVIEVVCGTLFRPFEAMLAPHLGLLWEKFKPEYSGCQEVPPLAPVIERFDEAPTPVMDFELMNKPPLPRIWFVHSNDHGIIQVQRDRFLHNWRKVRPEDEYPHYHSVIEMFRLHLSRFQLFLNEIGVGPPELLQYELTYVNHIPQGDGWTGAGDIGKVFPDLSWRADTRRFLPGPDGINWQSSFALPNRAGRLHMTIRRGIRRPDGHPLLLFELTARGIGNDKSPEGMWTWFNLAHEWIVLGFADLTGEEVQRNIWRRK